VIPITLSTIQNIRDLGGTKTADGRAIRPGRLIRSAHLAQASPEDLALLRRQYGLRRIIDLRTRTERMEKPDRTDGLEYLACPIIDELKGGITHEKKQGEPDRLPDMRDLYREMMTDEFGISGFRRVVETIFNHDFGQGAVLWHCSEGKDRCGMTTALVMTALGVDRNIIMADYLSTNQVNLPKARAVYEQLLPTRGKVFAESVYRAFIADESYLQAAWDVMGEDYLRGVLGIETETIERFQEAVLE